jgi:biopolymer transport protein TolR
MSVQGGGGGGRRPMSEMNVIPLVDIILVLLIMFMVAAPLITQGVVVSLPDARGQAIEDEEPKLVLAIDRERRIYIGEAEVALEDLEDRLKHNVRIQREREVYLHADRDLPYGFVVEVMAIARRSGVEALGMITDPLNRLPEEDAGD